MDAGEDLAVSASAVVERELQQLVGFLHGLARLDLDGAEIGLAERVKVDLLLRQRLDLQRGKRGLFLRCLDLLQLGQRLFRVDAGEDGLALVDGHICGQDAPRSGSIPRRDGRIRADLREDPLTGLRRDREQQRRADTHGLEQVIHDGGQTGLFALVLRELPRSRLVDILVRALDALERLVEAVLKLELVHLGLIAAAQTGQQLDERVVLRPGLALRRERAAEVFLNHRRRPGDEVAKVVGEVDVDRVDQQLVGEVAVGAERERAQQEEAQRVHAEALGQHIGIDDVALRLRHLAAVDDEPAVAVDMLRQRLFEAHEHCRPDNGVEPDNLLADDVYRGPVFRIVVVFFVLIAERRDIVGQRVEPDIDHVLRVERDGDTPRERRAGHTEVFKARIDEVFDHLVDAGARLQIVGVDEQIAHAIRVFGQAEEIGFLLRVVNLAAAVRAFAVLQLRFGPEALARRAVFALVRALIDVALVIHLLEDALDGFDMIVVGRADETVVRDVHQLPEVEDALFPADDLVHELLRGHARGLGLLFDLLAVLVRAGEEHHVLAAQPVIARDRVGRDGGIGVADVELCRRIIDRCCNIKRILFCHCISLFPAHAEWKRRESCTSLEYPFSTFLSTNLSKTACPARRNLIG